MLSGQAEERCALQSTICEKRLQEAITETDNTTGRENWVLKKGRRLFPFQSVF